MGLPLPVLMALVGFLLGCIVSGSIVMHLATTGVSPLVPSSNTVPPPLMRSQLHSQPKQHETSAHEVVPRRTSSSVSPEHHINASAPWWTDHASTTPSVLQGLRILVVLVAFDFSQIPHLEEVLDSYHDLAVAGAAHVHVVIHSTVAYPVALIDLWNDRFRLAAPNSLDENSPVQFEITIALKPKSLRLHLVDCHRQVFYENLSNYDLFIYSEDDIRVTPTTVASYWLETKHIESLLSKQEHGSKVYRPSDFNVGIVRYEYNYPANVIMDDNTRHATQNVTRVYWEHSGFERPNIFPDAAKTLEQKPLAHDYVTMKNHHQGMFLATAPLLQAWKERCKFDVATNRPGHGSQPTEGTQRVWMSSQMLYGGRHCNVQQVLPLQRFGTLTVWHLPNKNYRRVGKYRKRTFADGTEVFEKPHASLLQAMELHVALKKVQNYQLAAPQSASLTPQYKGVIRMIDQVDRDRDRTPLLERRLNEYQAYVDRGGILSDYDMTHTELVE